LPPQPIEDNLFNAAQLADGMVSELGDICDRDQLDRFFATQRPEIVFHLAAQPLVRRSYQQPVETFQTNVLGTVNVLEAVRRTPSVRCVVIVTSDKCYENREWHWGYRENDPLGGHDPYSASKGCAEIVASSYRRSYFSVDQRVALASARAGNVIGGGDWSEDRLVPDIVRSIVRNVPIEIRNPLAIRPWQHVLESLHGYLRLGQRLCEDRHAFAEAWNFGPRDDDTRSVQEIAQRLVDVWGQGKLKRPSGGDGAHEATLLTLDSSKARNRLNWRPLLRLDEALQLTAEWYCGYYACPADAAALLDRQLDFMMCRIEESHRIARRAA